MARTTASNFLYVFLAKCSSKTEEIDYRPIFENFVQDLLTTVNKPEWPAAELMLSVLGKLLVKIASLISFYIEFTVTLVVTIVWQCSVACTCDCLAKSYASEWAEPSIPSE